MDFWIIVAAVLWANALRVAALLAGEMLEDWRRDRKKARTPRVEPYRENLRTPGTYDATTGTYV